MTPNINLGYTRLIIEEGRKYGCLRNQLAYILATAYWETARTMKPVKEAYWVKNAEAWRKKNLRYYPWYGRGFVQLTWEDNYINAGEELGLDLTTNPDVVMEPNISAKILIKGSMEGWFTGKKIPDYITLTRSNFKSARKVINGLDKATQIASIARDYDEWLKNSLKYGENDEVQLDLPLNRTDKPAESDSTLSGTTTPTSTETAVSGQSGAKKISASSVLVSILQAIFGRKDK